MLKQYKFGFDIWGLILFFLIMLPNFIWLACPAPNDILRVASVTPALDTIASICQVLLVALLCVLIHQDRSRLSLSKLIIATLICIFLYYAGWCLYYCGITNALIILLLTLMPCLAFLFFAIDRKNKIALVPILIFMVCHFIYGVVNYII